MNMINYFVDKDKVSIRINEPFEIEDTRIAAFMKLKIFDLLLDVNKKTSKKFTDAQIAHVVNMTYKNAYNASRFGIHAGYWKYEEEIQEVFDAIKQFNSITKEHKEKPNMYYNSLANFCIENICRELVSAINMFAKAEADFHFISKGSKPDPDPYELLLYVISNLLDKDIITTDKFVYACEREYNEFSDAVIAYDTAINIVKGVETTYDDILLHILKIRTPELIEIANNNENKLKMDKKCLKELRILYRAKYNKGE